MEIKIDDLQFCEDCFYVCETGDESSLDYHYGASAEKVSREINSGIERLQKVHGGRLHANCNTETGEGITEFSRGCCDCCFTHLAGTRYTMLILGGK